MQIFLPIADVPVDLFVLLILGASVGFLSVFLALEWLSYDAAFNISRNTCRCCGCNGSKPNSCIVFSGVLAHLRDGGRFQMGNIWSLVAYWDLQLV